MGREFEYDSSGNTTIYFLMSGIVLYLVPATISRLSKKSDSEKDKVEELLCVCKPCRNKRHLVESRKKKEFISWGTIVYITAWVLLLVMAYAVTTFEHEAIWDPFEVLGLDSSATTQEIKKKYRDLSKQLHPDRNLGEETSAMFMRVAKAYEALTDDATRENWEKYGNPDGPQAASFGIALPKWIVDKQNSGLVLGVYVLLLIIVLPVVVASWWYKSMKYVKDEVLVKTVQRLTHYVTKSASIKGLVEAISLAEEFDTLKARTSDGRELPHLLSQLPDLPRAFNKFKAFTKENIKARIILHAHLERLDMSEAMMEDWLECMDKLPVLLKAVVDVVAYQEIREHGFLRVCLHTMNLQQMLVQALPTAHSEPLLQIPHFDDQAVRFCRSKRRKIRTVQQLFALDDDTIRNEVLHSLDETQLEDILAFGRAFPYLQVSHSVRVADKDVGDELTANAVLSVSIQLRRLSLDEWRAVEQTEENESDAEEEVPEGKLARSGFVCLGVPDVSQAKQSIGVNPCSWFLPCSIVPLSCPFVHVNKQQTNMTGKKKTKGGRGKRRRRVVKPVAALQDKEADESAPSDAKTLATTSQDASAKASSSEDNSDADASSGSDVDDDDDEAWEAMQRDLEKGKDKNEDDESTSFPVHCPFYPLEKQEGWWVFLGDEKRNRLLAPIPLIRVTTLKTEKTVTFKMQAPGKGVHHWVLYVVSDSYIGHQVRKEFKLDVQDAAPEDEVSEIEDSEEEEEQSDDESWGDSDSDF
eukprot:m.18533 g.18533  ORF g.18533 m.18533 type:complete len:754 (+) comp5743_c0_seq1:88-2349(+)